MLLFRHIIQTRRKKRIVISVDMRDYIHGFNTPLTGDAVRQKLTDTDYNYTVGVEPK